MSQGSPDGGNGGNGGNGHFEGEIERSTPAQQSMDLEHGEQQFESRPSPLPPPSQAPAREASHDNGGESRSVESAPPAPSAPASQPAPASSPAPSAPAVTWHSAPAESNVTWHSEPNQGDH